VAWCEALDRAIEAVEDFGADALVVPMGLDTFAGDPISGFTLRSEDYDTVGRLIAAASLPTVFTFEGGYAVAEVGVNAVNLLEGFCRSC
jgi:acetoin utilization deacetylase AcuC-like enzyme